MSHAWRLIIGSAASLVTTALAATESALSAQDLSILPRQQVQLISQEISGDASYEHIRFTTQFHKPGWANGANGLWEIAHYVESKAKEYGLDQVRVIKQPWPEGRPWNSRLADLWIVEPEPERIASTLQTQLHLADNSHPTDVTAALVDIGAGAEEDYRDKDVAGAIVLTYGSMESAMREAVIRRHALGVVWYPSPFRSRYVGYADQVNWTNVGEATAEGQPTFAFVLSIRQGLALSARLRTSKAPIKVHALVNAQFSSVAGDQPWAVLVEAFIRGSEPGLGQDVVLTAHMQEEKFSADDDGSGVGNTLEVARALSALIRDGRVPRPKRNIRFWWTTENQSERKYFADHPDTTRRLWVNVNQDMVGLNQGLNLMGAQNVTRLPATRFHFFNDVVEAVIEYMVATNTGRPPQQQAGTPLYPLPHLSHLGTRSRFDAKTVFYHSNTDHQTFNETPIGVPGITFTDGPNNYIHTSDDDLWTIDRTQLGRSAAAVALISYAMASAGRADLPALAGETRGRGAERQVRNLRLGLGWMASESDKASAYRAAVHQVRFAAARERRAVKSLAGVDSIAAAPIIVALLQGLDGQEARELEELERTYRVTTGKEPPPPAGRNPAEEELARLRPVVVGGPKEFFPKRDQVQTPEIAGLHVLMAFETLNAVDGVRSGLDIYRLVAAEAREAGSYHYGVVTADAVLQYLRFVAGLGLIRLS